MPKNPTVPLFIFVFTIIYGKLVLAKVGNKCPKPLINLIVMSFLSLSIWANI